MDSQPPCHSHLNFTLGKYAFLYTFSVVADTLRFYMVWGFFLVYISIVFMGRFGGKEVEKKCFFIFNFGSQIIF